MNKNVMEHHKITIDPIVISDSDLKLVRILLYNRLLI